MYLYDRKREKFLNSIFYGNNLVRLMLNEQLPEKILLINPCEDNIVSNFCVNRRVSAAQAGRGGVAAFLLRAGPRLAQPHLHLTHTADRPPGHTGYVPPVGGQVLAPCLECHLILLLSLPSGPGCD